MNKCVFRVPALGKWPPHFGSSINNEVRGPPFSFVKQMVNAFFAESFVNNGVWSPDRDAEERPARRNSEDVSRVPRPARMNFEDVSTNSLGFAGFS